MVHTQLTHACEGHSIFTAGKLTGVLNSQQCFFPPAEPRPGNHGVVAMGSSIEEAFDYTFHLVRASEIQVTHAYTCT